MALAIVGYALFASPPDWLRRRSVNRERPELATLVTALAGKRPFEPRVTGGFAAGARFEPKEPRPPDAMTAAARLIDQAGAQASPRVLGAAGTAHLVLGDADAAVRLLQQAVDRTPADAMLVNDLAAALLVRAATGGNLRDAERAAALAERASDLDPGLAESWFNRGLAFEALGLTEEAQKAWSQYLRVDSDSPWADEARRRQSRS